jgi:uncharacterized protein YecA (UPF0149 family)
MKRGYIDNGEYREQEVYLYYPETSDEYTTREKAITSIAVQHEMDHLSGLILPDYGFKSPPITTESKVGRNDPCPCGAMRDGKPVKYKKCCGNG